MIAIEVRSGGRGGRGGCLSTRHVIWRVEAPQGCFMKKLPAQLMLGMPEEIRTLHALVNRLSLVREMAILTLLSSL